MYNNFKKIQNGFVILKVASSKFIENLELCKGVLDGDFLDPFTKPKKYLFLFVLVFYVYIERFHLFCAIFANNRRSPFFSFMIFWRL